MKLSTMQAVVATLNEQWESELANTLLSAWAHDDEPAKYWRASANFIFFFKQAGQQYVLRFNHASERTRDTIQAEIDYVNYLATAGIAVAKPIRSLAGNDVESISTAHGLFHVVAFEALPGQLLAFDTLTPEQFMNWGKALGELHQAAQGYNQKGRPTWADHVAMVAETLPTTEQAAHQALHDVHKQLSQHGVNQQNFGLIHYDFELDNLVWQAERPGLIDFDDCAWYWFAADIAFALRDLFDDRAAKIDLEHPAFQQFIAGYRHVKPIDQAELDQLPYLMRLHNVNSFAKLQRALAGGPAADDPAWSVGLRQRLLAKMQFYRDEFSQPI
ncbi:MAG: phosphotransferase [Chloroflexi bacterium]|nr:phosphotransferase [Chloroflexota bacterium]